VGERRILLLERVHALDHARGAREPPEEARLGGGGAGQRTARGCLDLVARLVIEAGGLAQAALGLSENAGPRRWLTERLHLPADARQLLEADAVDLLGGQRERGVDLDEARIAGGPARDVADPRVGLVAGAREDLVVQEIAVARERRPDPRADGPV